MRDVVTERLRAAGAEVRLHDLYAAGFDPVLSRPEHEGYEDVETNRTPVDREVTDLLWCDTLIFVYPTWWYGMPAMLKGWLDRVLLPGVAFHLPGPEGNITPALQHIDRFGVFTTCGANWWLTRFVGAPGRRTLLRGLRILCGLKCRTVFSAHYLMDSSTPESRSAHLSRVARKMDRLLGTRARREEAAA